MDPNKIKEQDNQAVKFDFKDYETVEFSKDELAQYEKAIKDKTIIDMENRKKKEAPAIIQSKHMDKNAVKHPFGHILTKFAKGALQGGQPAIMEYKRKPTEDGGDYKSFLQFDGRSKSLGAAINKDLSSASLADGGALIPDQMFGELVPLLGAKTVLRKAGARVIPMPVGGLQMNKQTAGATAYWVGEASNITKSSLTVNQYKMTRKKLAAITVIDNDLLHLGGMEVDSMVEQDHINSIAREEDDAFINGAGSQYKPKGLYHWAASGQKADMTATPTSAKKLSDLIAAKGRLTKNNIPMENVYWFMNPQVETDLMSAYNATVNNPTFPDMMQGKLLGHPFLSSTNISTDEVYCVDVGQVIIGQTYDVRVEFFPNGSYYDGSNVVSGISTDQSVMRTITEVDLYVKYDTAISVIESVTWGA